MITLKCLNVVRQVATEEQALKLAAKGFIRTGGTAETVSDLEGGLAKMGEAMYERLSQQLKAAAQPAPAAPATPVPQGKAAKGGGKEADDAGADQPDCVDGAK